MSNNIQNAVHYMGERYIGCGAREGEIIIDGVPGNDLGAYLDGANITVYGNTQDATGNTMNNGVMTIYGNTGDALGYSMRGGEIYVRGNAGYRAGIHMKASIGKVPTLVIGGHTGSFLGEYQAGGNIIVLGLDTDGIPVGDFCGTGQHGGRIFLRTDKLPDDLPVQVISRVATEEDMNSIMPFIDNFCEKFEVDKAEVLKKSFYVLIPNSKNPYKQLYCYN